MSNYDAELEPEASSARLNGRGIVLRGKDIRFVTVGSEITQKDAPIFGYDYFVTTGSAVAGDTMGALDCWGPGLRWWRPQSNYVDYFKVTFRKTDIYNVYVIKEIKLHGNVVDYLPVESY